MRSSTIFHIAYLGASVSSMAIPAELEADKRQLLNDLSPGVGELVTALGLGSLAPGLTSTLDALGTDVKVKRQLLNDLSPGVGELVTALGLGSLAPGLTSTLDALGTDV